ncbi:hypothetical protein CC80DRAFT_506408 [Byssothecium circinans]|uniref:Uncharacterized protein n=1 Tax=Byssothecium circinans TaxID=147558 RepID=A0A6A5TZL2_9PLEO|nr:hypothetical protein CC80DRAFT_506408 [Byssothecium circinans]
MSVIFTTVTGTVVVSPSPISTITLLPPTTRPPGPPVTEGSDTRSKVSTVASTTFTTSTVPTRVPSSTSMGMPSSITSSHPPPSTIPGDVKPGDPMNTALFAFLMITFAFFALSTILGVIYLFWINYRGECPGCASRDSRIKFLQSLGDPLLPLVVKRQEEADVAALAGSNNSQYMKLPRTPYSRAAEQVNTVVDPFRDPDGMFRPRSVGPFHSPIPEPRPENYVLYDSDEERAQRVKHKDRTGSPDSFFNPYNPNPYVYNYKGGGRGKGRASPEEDFENGEGGDLGGMAMNPFQDPEPPPESHRPYVDGPTDYLRPYDIDALEEDGNRSNVPGTVYGSHTTFNPYAYNYRGEPFERGNHANEVQGQNQGADPEVVVPTEKFNAAARLREHYERRRFRNSMVRLASPPRPVNQDVEAQMQVGQTEKEVEVNPTKAWYNPFR